MDYTDYTDTEKHLIALAESWRNSKNYQSAISTDNTPFQPLGRFGLPKARAILGPNGWEFRAIVRNGCNGVNRPTLQESLDWAIDEDQNWYADMVLRANASRLGDSSNPPSTTPG